MPSSHGIHRPERGVAAFAHGARNRARSHRLRETVKLEKLGRKYGVAAFGYKGLHPAPRKCDIDAVYIALPNSQHVMRRCLQPRLRVHVLCENVAVKENDCQTMIRAAQQSDIKLMVAYRLHFERANLEAVQIVQSGKLGDPRAYNSSFSMQVKPGDIRLDKELGGGPLYDIGIYSINAARYLFQDEPESVLACSASRKDPRFKEVDEMTGAILRFPNERLATLGAASVRPMCRPTRSRHQGEACASILLFSTPSVAPRAAHRRAQA